MKLHELKTLPEYFIEVASGKKTFEVRKNDRDYKVDDILYLREYDDSTGLYTDDYAIAKVSYILEGGAFGIDKDHVVMSIVLLDANYGLRF